MGHRPLLVFVAQHTDRAGAKAEQATAAGTDAEPGAGEGPQQVAVGKQRHIALIGNRHGAFNHCAAALLYGRGILSPWAAMAPDRPAWTRLLNLGGGEAFVTAVIPFPQLLKQLSPMAEPRKCTGAPRSLQRRAKHRGESHLRQHCLEAPGLLLSLGEQGQIRAARMASAQSPLGGPMPQQPQPTLLHGGSVRSA